LLKIADTFADQVEMVGLMMGAVVASSPLSWSHIAIVCSRAVSVGILVWLFGLMRRRRHAGRSQAADDGNPIVNALLHLLELWPF
jgi:hypothetical protein